MRKNFKLLLFVLFITVLTACGSISSGDISNQDTMTDDMHQTEYIEMFGSNCITNQTFLIEMSEYDGEVYFVPTAPANPEEALWLSFMQEGEVLNRFSVYVPDGVEEWDFPKERRRTASDFSLPMI